MGIERNLPPVDALDQFRESARKIADDVLDELGSDLVHVSPHYVLQCGILRGINFGVGIGELQEDIIAEEDALPQDVVGFFADDSPVDYDKKVVVPIAHGRELRARES